MLRWLFVLLLIPFLDAVLLAAIAWQTGLMGLVGMVLLVVLTGLIGLLLVHAEGKRTLYKVQRRLARGEVPSNELLDAGLLIAAAAFLLTPGLVTDALGFLLIVPLTRIPIRMGLKRFVVVPYMDRKTDGFASGVVWTAGFPEGAQATSHSADADDTVDLGGNAYRVDESGDSYTIEFDDGATASGERDETTADDDGDADDGDDGRPGGD